MTKYCCVPGCKQTGGFQFPKDTLLRKHWCIAVRRETRSKKLWTPSKHSVVCKKHFKEEDFAKSPIERLRIDLVKGAVPSIFEFVKNKSSDEDVAILARRERNERRKTSGTKQIKLENSDVEAEETITNLSNNEATTVEDIDMLFQFDLYGNLFFISIRCIKAT
jgi:hypothetical protein